MVLGHVCEIESLAGLLHAMVEFISICCFIHVEAPHAVGVTVKLLLRSHQFVLQSPGKVLLTPVLILHVESSFVGGDILNVRQCLGWVMLHIKRSPGLQGCINVIVDSDSRSGQIDIGMGLMLGSVVGTSSKEVPGGGLHWCIQHAGCGLEVGVMVRLRVGFLLEDVVATR